MLKIINAALLAQGQEPVSSGDGSIEWRVLSDNWPAVIEAELEDGNFHFTREETSLIVRTDGKFGFDDAYQVPADALHVRNVWVESGDVRYDVDWVQDSTHVHLNSDTGCVIEYVVSADPSLWTAAFSLGIQYRLEAIILRSLKEEYSESLKLEEMAAFQLQRARTKSASSRSKVPPIKGGGSIADARMRRG